MFSLTSLLNSLSTLIPRRGSDFNNFWSALESEFPPELDVALVLAAALICCMGVAGLGGTKLGYASGVRAICWEVMGEDRNDARPVIWAGVSWRILHLS